MENISIRQLNKDDWGLYREIRLEALQNDPSAFGGTYSEESKRIPEQWQERLSRDRLVTMGLFIDKKLVSIGSLGFWDKKNEYGISAVYTDKIHRGKGLSKKVFEEIIKKAKDLNISKITLMVNTENKPAVNFYTSIGFKTIEVLKEQKMGDGNYYDEFFMEKVL